MFVKDIDANWWNATQIQKFYVVQLGGSTFAVKGYIPNSTWREEMTFYRCESSRAAHVWLDEFIRLVNRGEHFNE